MNEEAAPEASLGKRVLTYAVTLVVAAVVIYGISEFLTPIQPPKQGDCALLTGDTGRSRYQSADCSANANYVAAGTVAASQDCPNGEDRSWVPVRAIDPKVRFCLVPLYAEGECYSGAKSTYDLNVVDCGDENAFEVTRVGKGPAPSCAAGEKALAYPEVELTYCLRQG
jgi:hypothetical protein